MLDTRYEIEFWSQIMKDHGVFLYNSLAPNENEAISLALHYTNVFGTINLEATNTKISNEELIKYSRAALTQFIDFKSFILSNLINCKIKIGMTPSFINHMINEAFEFLRVLNIADKIISYDKILELLRLHNIWLHDASCHASSIAAKIDPLNASLINQAEEFAKKFDALSKNAFQSYLMYERTRLYFNSIDTLNKEIIIALTEFNYFLKNIEELRANCNIFASGTLIPLLPEHMIREEQYYISKIKELIE